MTDLPSDLQQHHEDLGLLFDRGAHPTGHCINGCPSCEPEAHAAYARLRDAIVAESKVADLERQLADEKQVHCSTMHELGQTRIQRDAVRAKLADAKALCDKMLKACDDELLPDEDLEENWRAFRATLDE